MCPDAAFFDAEWLPADVTRVSTLATNEPPECAARVFHETRAADGFAVMATHNPAVVDEVEFAYPEDVQSAFIIAVDAPDVGGVWRNLTHDECQRVFSAARVGVQHMNRILRTRGLW